MLSISYTDSQPDNEYIDIQLIYKFEYVLIFSYFTDDFPRVKCLATLIITSVGQQSQSFYNVYQEITSYRRRNKYLRYLRRQQEAGLVKLREQEEGCRVLARQIIYTGKQQLRGRSYQPVYGSTTYKLRVLKVKSNLSPRSIYTVVRTLKPRSSDLLYPLQRLTSQYLVLKRRLAGFRPSTTPSSTELQRNLRFPRALRTFLTIEAPYQKARLQRPSSTPSTSSGGRSSGQLITRSRTTSNSQYRQDGRNGSILRKRYLSRSKVTPKTLYELCYLK